MEFGLFKGFMLFDTQGRFCIEIQFSANANEKFDYCWMGKMPDGKNKHDVFWYGLTSDGKNAYDYSTFEDFSNAEVFDGRSLTEIWYSVIINQINDCDPIGMVQMYLSGTYRTGAPR